MALCLGKSRDSRRRPAGQLEEETLAWQIKGWFSSDSSDGSAGKAEDDQRNHLNGVMRGNAKSAAVIGLAGSVGVRNLNNSANQDKRNTNKPQES